MAHGYFLIGPFYILGPLRNSENALLVGLTSAMGLILVLTLGLTIYGLASFQDGGKFEGLESSKGWRDFTSGFCVRCPRWRCCCLFPTGKYRIFCLEGNL